MLRLNDDARSRDSLRETHAAIKPLVRAGFKVTTDRHAMTATKSGETTRRVRIGSRGTVAAGVELRKACGLYTDAERRVARANQLKREAQLAVLDGNHAEARRLIDKAKVALEGRGG